MWAKQKDVLPTVVYTRIDSRDGIYLPSLLITWQRVRHRDITRSMAA